MSIILLRSIRLPLVTLQKLPRPFRYRRITLPVTLRHVPLNLNNHRIHWQAVLRHHSLALSFHLQQLAWPIHHIRTHPMWQLKFNGIIPQTTRHLDLNQTDILNPYHTTIPIPMRLHLYPHMQPRRQRRNQCRVRDLSMQLLWMNAIDKLLGPSVGNVTTCSTDFINRLKS